MTLEVPLLTDWLLRGASPERPLPLIFLDRHVRVGSRALRWVEAELLCAKDTAAKRRHREADPDVMRVKEASAIRLQ